MGTDKSCGPPSFSEPFEAFEAFWWLLAPLAWFGGALGRGVWASGALGRVLAWRGASVGLPGQGQRPCRAKTLAGPRAFWPALPGALHGLGSRGPFRGAFGRNPWRKGVLGVPWPGPGGRPGGGPWPGSGARKCPRTSPKITKLSNSLPGPLASLLVQESSYQEPGGPRGGPDKP